MDNKHGDFLLIGYLAGELGEAQALSGTTEVHSLHIMRSEGDTGPGHLSPHRIRRRESKIARLVRDIQLYEQREESPHQTHTIITPYSRMRHARSTMPQTRPLLNAIPG